MASTTRLEETHIYHWRQEHLVIDGESKKYLLIIQVSFSSYEEHVQGMKGNDIRKSIELPKHKGTDQTNC